MRDNDLEGVLMRARQILKRGDGWGMDNSLHDRLRRDLDEIGHPCNDCAITTALRTSLAEIQRIRKRHEPSWGGTTPGQTLYDGRWMSNYFGCEMYVKFAINEEEFELFSLHKHREGNSPHEMH